jgi:hypothetical protein
MICQQWQIDKDSHQVTTQQYQKADHEVYDVFWQYQLY